MAAEVAPVLTAASAFNFLTQTTTTNFYSLYTRAPTPAFLLFLKAIFIIFPFALDG